MPPFSAAAWPWAASSSGIMRSMGMMRRPATTSSAISRSLAGSGWATDRDDVDRRVQLGVGGWAEDGGEGAARLDLGEQGLGGGLADGVGDGVDEAELVHLLLVVEGDDLIGAEGFGLLLLRLFDAGDDDGSRLLGGEDGGAADAADGSGDEDGLALLDLGAAGDELLAGLGDEREGGGFDEVELFGDEGEVGGLDGDQLGVGVEAMAMTRSPGEKPVTPWPRARTTPERSRPRMAGKLERHEAP